jgi:uncharacterized RmlC-like cupin family protein
VAIPPAVTGEAHLHPDHETAIYLLEGDVETRYGADLSDIAVSSKGDFVFIDANVPHQARNLSDTDWALAVIARSHPSYQEPVVPHYVHRGY